MKEKQERKALAMVSCEGNLLFRKTVFRHLVLHTNISRDPVSGPIIMEDAIMQE
jgi:hypothetical protein